VLPGEWAILGLTSDPYRVKADSAVTSWADTDDHHNSLIGNSVHAVASHLVTPGRVVVVDISLTRQLGTHDRSVFVTTKVRDQSRYIVSESASQEMAESL
jgi:hypothetical protein